MVQDDLNIVPLASHVVSYGDDLGETACIVSGSNTGAVLFLSARAKESVPCTAGCLT